MRRTGTFSLLASLGIHGMLLGAVVLCVGEIRSTPPRIHLVYGEVGAESSGVGIVASGEEKAPAVNVQSAPVSNSSTDAMDALLMGGSGSALGDALGELATPL